VHKPEVESWHKLQHESSALIWGAFACAGILLLYAIGQDGPACDCVRRQSLKGPERVKLGSTAGLNEGLLIPAVQKYG
jgi:hypothetical protein